VPYKAGEENAAQTKPAGKTNKIKATPVEDVHAPTDSPAEPAKEERRESHASVDVLAPVKEAERKAAEKELTEEEKADKAEEQAVEARVEALNEDPESAQAYRKESLTSEAEIGFVTLNEDKTNADQPSSPKVVNFLVLDMTGNSRIFQAVSIKDLRIQLAIQAGVFYPCIELFKRSTYALLANAHEITQIFNSETEPYEIYVVNNEKGVKREVGAWDGSKWIDVLGGYIEQGDRGLLECARLVDLTVKEKIRIYTIELMNVGFLLPELPVFSNIVSIVRISIFLNMDILNGYAGSVAPLMFAAAIADHDLLRILIEQGFDVNAVGILGGTPLTHAIRWGKLDAARALLRLGADPNPPGTPVVFWSPLHYAAVTGHSDMVAYLIDARAAVSGISDTLSPTGEGMPDQTPLHLASMLGHGDIIQLLLEAGADKNAINRWGDTPADVLNELQVY